MALKKVFSGTIPINFPPATRYYLFWPFDNGGEDIKREVIGFDFFKDLPTVAKLYFAKLFPSLF